MLYPAYHVPLTSYPHKRIPQADKAAIMNINLDLFTPQLGFVNIK